MDTNTPTTLAPRLTGTRRHVRAVLLAGALTFGASVLGQSATANAEWDTEKYDRCMYVPGINPVYCCIDSGGRIGSNGVCTAPWNDVAIATPNFQPTKQSGPIVAGQDLALATQGSRPRS